jgi:hypothetical protein
MPYIGNDIQYGELTSETFTGDGSTVAFTMGYTVANTTSILVTSGNVVQEPTVAYTVAGTTLTFTSAPEDGDTIHVRYLGRTLDVSQTAIVQDTDQDTKIQVEESADEDTIRFDAAGAEVATVTSSAITLKTATNTTIANDGGDTAITINNSAGGGSTDETATLAFQHASQPGGKISSLRDADYASGANEDSKLAFYTGQNGTDNLKMLLGETGWLHIGNSVDGNVNAKNDGGLTINQGSKDDEILAFKSSDIAHGVTGEAETDTYAMFRKNSATLGGLHILALQETNGQAVCQLNVIAGGALDTTKTASGIGSVNFQTFMANGTAKTGTITADGNLFSIRDVSGTRFILDEDGDIHNDGADSAAFDAWDDAALLRALELWRGLENPETVQPQLLASRYDGNKYTKEQMETAKVIQVVSDEDWKNGERSLVNTSAQARVTTGAIWQNHEMLDAIIETMEERDSGFTAALKEKFEARGLPTQILDWDGDIPDDLKKPDTAPKAFNAD